MRTTFSIYHKLYDFINHADAEALARGEGPEDVTIDAHFRSGVYLGAGASKLIFSLLPGKLVSFVELLGYSGDRNAGLQLFCRAGGWTREAQEPSIGTSESRISFPIPFADGNFRRRGHTAGDLRHCSVNLPSHTLKLHIPWS
jgi:hypothetical protein